MTHAQLLRVVCMHTLIRLERGLFTVYRRPEPSMESIIYRCVTNVTPVRLRVLTRFRTSSSDHSQRDNEPVIGYGEPGQVDHYMGTHWEILLIIFPARRRK